VAQLSPDQLFWIKDACRRLSSSTGWPIVFRTLEELPTESPLPAPAYQHQEAGLIGGMLCVDLPPEYVQHDDTGPRCVNLFMHKPNLSIE